MRALESTSSRCLSGFSFDSGHATWCSLDFILKKKKLLGGAKAELEAKIWRQHSAEGFRGKEAHSHLASFKSIWKATATTDSKGKQIILCYQNIPSPPPRPDLCFCSSESTAIQVQMQAVLLVLASKNKAF